MVGGADWRRAAILLAPPLLAGIMLGANQARAGAYLSWPLSIGYWLSLSFATWTMLAAATGGAILLLRPWHPPRWLPWAVGAVSGSLAARPLIYAIADAFRPMMAGATVRDMPAVELTPAFTAYYLTNWSLVLAMWIATCWFAARFPSRRPIGDDATIALAREPNRDEIAGFMRRLPPEIGREIIALQAEDHYVRVHTRLGSALVLGGISDAIRTLADAGLAGQRVHRSWWVATGAVDHILTGGRRMQAVLTNGVEVPVSQTYRELAKAAGVLPRTEANEVWLPVKFGVS